MDLSGCFMTEVPPDTLLDEMFSTASVDTRKSEPSHQAGPELSVIVPTYNERDNVNLLLDRLDNALAEVRWHVIFVDDDSPDQTAAAVKTLAQSRTDVQCLHRRGRRGLAGAVKEGIQASAAPFVAVMDADLQHDEACLISMLRELRSGDVDLVVGSRFQGGRNRVSGLSVFRERMSRLTNRLMNIVVGGKLTDPLSGFFAMRRDAFDRIGDRISDDGFKILLDIVASSPPTLRVREIPFEFAPRKAGASKLDFRVALDFAGLILSKITHGFVPQRFLPFALIGGTGVLVHLLVLKLSLGLGFTSANLTAALIAMASNYTLNNFITYRDRRLSGWRFVIGFFKFFAFCGLGLAVNMGAASIVFNMGMPWWVAGGTGAVAAGIWNYATATKMVW